MNRTQLKQRVLDALPPYYQHAMGRHAQTVTAMIVDSTLDIIMKTTFTGEKVELPGFATFSTAIREPHIVFCHLSDKPEFKVTKPYVRVHLRPSAVWKEGVSKRVEHEYDEKIKELQQLAKERTRQRQGGDSGEVRV